MFFEDENRATIRCGILATKTNDELKTKLEQKVKLSIREFQFELCQCFGALAQCFLLLVLLFVVVMLNLKELKNCSVMTTRKKGISFDVRKKVIRKPLK